MVVTLTPIPGIPLVRPRDDLAELLILACERQAISPKEGDVLVLAQKVVSKAEARYIDLATVVPSARAQSLAAEVEKDPRLVEVILGESRRVVRRRPGILIVEHRLGFVMANAGVDRSNVDPEAGAEPVLLLPRDPDGSAATLLARLSAHFGKPLCRDHQRQLGSSVAPGYRGRRARSGGASGRDGSARPSRSVRPRAARHRDRICR